MWILSAEKEFFFVNVILQIKFHLLSSFIKIVPNYWLNHWKWSITQRLHSEVTIRKLQKLKKTQLQLKQCKYPILCYTFFFSLCTMYRTPFIPPVKHSHPMQCQSQRLIDVTFATLCWKPFCSISLNSFILKRNL